MKAWHTKLVKNKFDERKEFLHGICGWEKILSIYLATAFLNKKIHAQKWLQIYAHGKISNLSWNKCTTIVDEHGNITKVIQITHISKVPMVKI